MYQILSQSVRFCRLYIREHFDVCFLVHSVVLVVVAVVVMLVGASITSCFWFTV